jgi:hypothetical protein
VSPAVQPHQRSEKLRIYKAVPEGSARARSQPAALRALETRIALEGDLGRLRADAEKNALLVARALVFSAHWKTMVARPGWDTLIDRTGLSRSTIQRVIRRLRNWGFLGVVETGSTWRTRGCRRGDDEGDLGAEYVLCVPSEDQVSAATPERDATTFKPVEISDSPSLLRQEERSKPHASARENATPTADQPWPMHQTPRTRGQRLAATRRLQNQAPVLARPGTRQLRSILRLWYDRGWTPAQVLYALDHGPDGALRWHTADVRHVPGWIRHRLAAWDGHTPPRQLGAGRSTDLTAGDVAQLPAAGERSTVNVATHATPLRQILAATQKRSDKKRAARQGLGVNLPGRDGEAPATVVEAPVELGGGDGGWLLRNAAARARTTPDMPGRAIA